MAAAAEIQAVPTKKLYKVSQLQNTAHRATEGTLKNEKDEEEQNQSSPVQYPQY